MPRFLPASGKQLTLRSARSSPIIKKDSATDCAKLFDTFALLEKWNFTKPDECTFFTEKHGSAGEAIPQAIQKKIEGELFVPEDFEKVALLNRRKLARPSANFSTNSRNLVCTVSPAFRGWVRCRRLSGLDAFARRENSCSTCAVSISFRRKLVKRRSDCWQRIKGKIGYGGELKQITMHMCRDRCLAVGAVPLRFLPRLCPG